MLNHNRRTALAFSISAVIILLTCVPHAMSHEEEVMKKLVGTWEGTVAMKNEPFRTLIIDSPIREGDEWVAPGRWRSTEDKRGMKVNIRIQVKGSDALLEFEGGKGNNVSLKLVGDREMTGLLNHQVARQRRNAQVALKKVD